MTNNNSNNGGSDRVKNKKFIDSDSDVELDSIEYKKFLQSLFPSNHMNKKVADAIKSAKIENDDSSDLDERLIRKKARKHRRVIEDSDDESVEEIKGKNKKAVVDSDDEEEGTVRIVFEIKGGEDDYDSCDDEYGSEDSDDSDSEEDS